VPAIPCKKEKTPAIPCKMVNFRKALSQLHAQKQGLESSSLVYNEITAIEERISYCERDNNCKFPEEKTNSTCFLINKLIGKGVAEFYGEEFEK
jgi:hypothetical protein